MEVNEILKQLEVFSTPFPRAAVEAAVERRDEIAPRLVRLLEEAVENALRRAHQEPAYMAHLYAMFLLAQFRDRRAYAPLIRLARLRADLPDLLLGDAVTESLPQALASVWDGDLEPIQSLIEDEAADDFCRMAGLGAIVTLVGSGEVARDAAIAYFTELFDGRLRAPDSVWGALVNSACDLHPGELYPRIARAFEQGLVDDMMVTIEEVRDAARESLEEALAKTRRSRHGGLITDVVGEMEWWACFQEPDGEVEDDWEEPVLSWTGSANGGEQQPIRRTQPKIGRNDPCPCGSGKKFKKCCGR